MDELKEKIENMIAEKLADHDKLSCADIHELASAYSELEKNEMFRRLADCNDQCGGSSACKGECK